MANLGGRSYHPAYYLVQFCGTHFFLAPTGQKCNRFAIHRSHVHNFNILDRRTPVRGPFGAANRVQRKFLARIRRLVGLFAFNISPITDYDHVKAAWSRNADSNLLASRVPVPCANPVRSNSGTGSNQRRSWFTTNRPFRSCTLLLGFWRKCGAPASILAPFRGEVRASP